MKPWLTPLAIMIALAGLTLWAKHQQAMPAAVQVIDCQNPVAGCAFMHHGQPVHLRFSAVPKPMEAFDIELYAPAVRKVSAQFRMSGMDMGFNRYDFTAGQGGQFKAKSIILPICTQARSDWNVIFSLDDKNYQVDFQAP
ncbi:MAG: hypothetical protein WBX11_10740 [Thiobacillaceae bacterium]